ncbi:glutamate receptor ionotropic, delta-1-like isoform X1 [Ischnura elegans]|uniref:glutamate receptor ionotropic, delta-1-like isoform X1 n=1 Tax=Ischnura elegans TaxID=197161 RepID=UPI001ED8A554|nr:glutamate receptor ionotropic, delta-1-like isoform X1 [Ischnura elegans]
MNIRIFELDYIVLKSIIRAASSKFVHLQILPFLKDANNSTAFEKMWSLYSSLAVIPAPLIVVIYDNSAEAVEYLRKASKANHFRGRYKWLILTNQKILASLEGVLQQLDINVDSDITIGLCSTDGTVELLDIYILQKEVHQSFVGRWIPVDVTETESPSTNTSLSTVELQLGNFSLNKPEGKLFRRSNLYGFNLRVVTVNVSSFYTLILLDPVTQLPKISGGYFGEVFNILSETMNFTHTINLLDGYAYGVVLSVSYNIPNWTGLVGELQHKRADVSACEVSMVPNRRIVMDYSMPLQIISRRIYIHRPMRSGVGAGGSKSEATWYKGGGFVRPFAMQVWFCITASLLLFLGAARLHAYFTFPRKRKNYNEDDIAKQIVMVKGKKRMKKVRPSGASPKNPPLQPTLSSDLFRFTATLVQQGLPDDPDPDESKGQVNSLQSRRLILWTASVTYLIIYTSYGAKLAAILASESEPQPLFTDLEGLLQVSNWKFGFLEKGLGRVSFESAEPDSVMGRLWSEKIVDEPDVLVPDIETGLHKALKEHYAFMGFHTGVQGILVQSLRKKETEKAEFTKSEVCRLMDLPNDYLKGGIAFGFQKESPYRPYFDNWLLLIRSCGLLDRLAKTWIPETLPCLEDQTVATVGLIDIAPALSALLFGLGLSITLLLIEILYDSYRKRPNRKKLFLKYHN